MKITIHKFKALQELAIEIPAEIKGANASGKTTILEAISFVLTGKDLSGNEFKQVYDYRQDLHDAVADVSYFDDYGNEYRRTVSAVFQTSRAGIEEIKVKRNTVCRKNGIAVNDFSDEFSDFAKLGTDYFFRQKEDVQRSIFIEAMKSKMPDYDVTANSLKLKELKKSQKQAIADIDTLRKMQKCIIDVAVPEIDSELSALNKQYETLASVDNSAEIEKVNKLNNILMSNHQSAKNRITVDINTKSIRLFTIAESIPRIEADLNRLKSLNFEPLLISDTNVLSEQFDTLKTKLSTLEYYDTLEHYAAKNFAKNPVLVANQKLITEINADSAEVELSSDCPLNGQFCEVAKLNSKQAKIAAIKAENRAILQGQMSADNTVYLTAKSQADYAEKMLNDAIERNKKIHAENDEKKRAFDIDKTNKIANLEAELKKLAAEKIEVEQKVKELSEQLEQLVEPVMAKLPESMEISEDLKMAHQRYQVVQTAIIEANAVNMNNSKNRAKWENEISENQGKLFELNSQITDLTAQISDYFSNLKSIVSTEFAGEIEIGVELLEYVISKDEYKDCFRITANGKVFPYECNGALQNNTKLQVLATLQRLKGYTGITVMDNCESNTSTPINTCGLKCVLTYATHDKELVY